ncbi:tudor domain-containing protein 1 isoform X4 [Peromyscus californicus insignis]|uniref:tudor domain-containing protein 1 isoform X4 n=1 Tax=Peromyscus californicus insignis TaxID=564181 RepID=UPI0022A7E261|nr:tudor domain-containing protein 1 isoform X4 [Peromyscus californicus insignis]
MAARRALIIVTRPSLGEGRKTSMNVNLPPNMMPRNNLEASTCKMAEPFNFEKKESKLPPQDSLRSPVAQHNHPNFRLKSPESGNKKNSFLLCEQSKPYLSSQEDNSVISSNPACISGEVCGTKGDRKILPTGNPVSPLSLENSSPPNQVKTKPNNNVSPEKSKKSHKLFENALSVNNPALFNSLGPPLRSTTCHRCGLFGSLRCSQCKQTYYCSTACQRRDWSSHSTICRPVQQSLHKLEDNKSPFETKSTEVKNEQSECPLGVTRDMATGAERVMLSDLRSLQLKKTMEVKGTVTEFKHPSNFYVQLYSSEVFEHMNQLSTSLKETYANTVPEDGYLPVKGEVCVAKYTVDQTWNRAIIQGIDVLQKKAQVLYIDYGNEEVIPIDRIHPLNKSIDLFPPSAIKCFVAGVIPAEGEWSEACVASVKALLLEQYCSVTIMDVLEEGVLTCAVDVVIESSGKQLDHVLVEMGYGVRPDEQNAEKQSVDQSTPEDMGRVTPENKIVIDRNALIPKMLTLKVGDEFCGVVAHIQTPEDFFCQQLQSGHKLAELQESLSEYCGQVTPRSDFYPTIGDVCCAQFSEDDQWYRASVLAYASEESVLVGYVDYGNFEILSLKRLCPIIPKLLDLPMQALNCVLAGVKPSLGIWTPEAICLMKKIVQNKMVTVRVVDMLGTRSLVELVDKSVIPHVSASKALIDSGFAVEETETVADKSGSVHTANVPLAIEETVEPLEWTWVEFSIDETVDVMVCMMYSPGEFYCHFLKDDALKKLDDLNKSLAEYCAQKLPNGFKAEVGRPCCAFFAGDGNWYRALVKEILPNGNVKVRFVDYGNIEEVTADQLQAISPPFLLLPFQGMQCWLVDIQPKNKHWTKEAIARFQACVVGLKLQARVVEITEKGVGVELTDLSTPYPKIISDVLITEHLVSKCGSPQKDSSICRLANEHNQMDTQGVQGDDLWYRAIVLEMSDSDVKVLYADYGNIETLPLSRVQPVLPSHLELPFQIIRCSLEGLTELNGSCSQLVMELLKNTMLNQSVVLSVKGISQNVHTVSVEKCSENGVINIAEKLLMCSMAENLTSKRKCASPLETTHSTDCCCTELQKQIEKHEQILLFLLNNPTNQNKFIEMKNLLKS